MDTKIWIVLGILILLALFAVMAFILKRKDGKLHKTDYGTMFIMGIIFMALGLANSDSAAFWIIGLIFMLVGATHKSEWEKPKRWHELDKNEKVLKGTLISVLLITLVAGIIVLVLSK